MKKSVVILIGLIYVASIALVGFLGLQAKFYNDVIYLESFEILTGVPYLTVGIPGILQNARKI